MTERTDIFFDFEFIDDGREIVPISLGMCMSLEHGLEVDHGSGWNEIYIEYQFDPARANDWVRENVFRHLIQPDFAGHGHPRLVNTASIQRWVKKVCGDTKPRFWGWYPAYDWVCLCQHFGQMVQLPKGWPYMPLCLAQYAYYLGVLKEDLPIHFKKKHNALDDAKWNRAVHAYLQGQKGND